jgi:UDP-N-acetylglucosamine 2-epimerase (non-hydrolysing)
MLMKEKKIYIFIGTVAELIKLAPVIKELNKRKNDFTLITSGQTDIHFKEFAEYNGPIKNVISLKEKEQKSSLIHFVLWAAKTFIIALISLRKEFKGANKKKVYFIVHGDTVSALIGALVATFYHLKLVHIESGLRSFNFFEPFPEEICRYIISNLAAVHFCPNQWSENNLKNHNGKKVNTKQNTLIESFWLAIGSKKPLKLANKISGKYFVLVIHRQEHVMFQKTWSKNIFEFIMKNSPQNLKCVFLVHDLTANFLQTTGYNMKEKRLILIPRLPFVDFIKLMDKSEFVISDGGSNQEELSYMGKPCLILRNSTERVEGLGKNALLSMGRKEIINDFFANYKKYKQPRISKSFRPSKIIVDYLVKY